MLKAIEQRSARSYSDYNDKEQMKADVAYLLGYINREQEFKEELASRKMDHIFANKEPGDDFRKV